MDGIFISYRRDDASGYAGRLYDRLKAHFGDDRVFMDVAEIEPGTDFVEAIERAVGSCRVLIVLIGDEWLAMRDAQGQRRLDDPQDFIRLEVATALRRGIRVVPVVLDRATMPRAEELPEELKPLARRQAIALQHLQWEASTGALIQALQRLLGEAPAGMGGARWPRRALAASAAGVAAVGLGAWWFWPEATRDEQEVGLLVAAAPTPAPSTGTGGTGAVVAAPASPRPAEAVVAAAPVPTPHAATGGPERAPLAAA
ncbi:MAG TPA: toll/interleukin-1 receptor domain-containing protein, partial [Hydrogenophaga sp.]|uniref:toll/interleukin-1 receptor domain-containing protein n=1 Tax=Hydrogenophaga sp. TaxID=1904254 RepID=UPI002C614953